MEIFTQLFQFLWSLFDIVYVTIGGFRFSLGGAVVFAVIVGVALYVLRWIFTEGGD